MLWYVYFLDGLVFCFSLYLTIAYIQHISIQSNKKTKVQSIVTLGGAFPDGAQIMKLARKQVNYFGASC